MDLKLRFKEGVVFDSKGDIAFNVNDADLDYGLTTSVLISLFTDRRALEDDDIPDGTDDRRGWWGDTVSSEEDDLIGSRLWLLKRSKTTNENLSKAKTYIEEALEWMIEDGVAAEIEVTTERIFYASDGNYTLGAKIDILKSSGEVVSINFNDLWMGQFSTTEV